MNKLFKYYRISFKTGIVLAVWALLFTASCNDDDGISVDPDAPSVNASEGLFTEGGRDLDLTFSLIAPGTISATTVSASQGTATLINAEELTGNTSGLARVRYVTDTQVKGMQTVTLTVTDRDGKETSATANVEVFAPIRFGLALVSGAGNVNTTFLQGLLSLDVDNLDNSDATELPGFAAVYSDNEALYTAGFGGPATMTRFAFNSEGEAVRDQQIIVPGSNSFSSVEIVNPGTGYATVGGGISRAIRFDPAEMRITGEIDLSGAGDGLFYSDMIVRDNLLFITLNDFGTSGEVKIAVVNTTTNELIKVITDSRSSTPFGTLTTSILTTDADDNIYVQASGLFSEKPSGVLRIKAGETEFDQEYFFNLTEAAGGSCFGLYNFDGGVAFTAVSEDDNNWFGFDGANPVFRYHKLDLASRKDEGDISAAVPNSFAASRSMFFMRTSENEIVFPVAGTDEDAVYSYDLNSGTVTRKILSQGGYISGIGRIF